MVHDEFDAWFNEHNDGNYSLRSEYFYEDMNNIGLSYENAQVVVSWLYVAFAAGAQSELSKRYEHLENSNEQN